MTQVSGLEADHPGESIMMLIMMTEEAGQAGAGRESPERGIMIQK